MSDKPRLIVDFCSHEAAKYAVMHWHYSRRMPSGKLIKFGVWEDGEFIGVVLFGRGSNNHIGTRYDVKQTEVCELVRVALRKHTSPVSQAVSLCVKRLRDTNPGMRLLVSYADPAQQHFGVIYQAMNWIYVGKSNAQRELSINGEWMHKRTASAKWGTAAPEKIREKVPGLSVEYGPEEYKYTYLMPLDKWMRKQILPLAQPYPKPDEQAQLVDEHSGNHAD